MISIRAIKPAGATKSHPVKNVKKYSFILTL